MNDSTIHGGLYVPPGMDSVGEQAEENIHKRWEYSEEVSDYLENELGISPPSEPQFACPTLSSEDLTNPDSTAYSTRYAEFMAWYTYLTEVLSRHESKLLEYEYEMEDIASNIRESLRKNSTRKTKDGETKAPSAGEMEDRIQVNPRFIELKQRKLRSTEIIKRLSAKTEGLYRQIQLLSRQVEIRRQNFDGNNRGGTVQGRGGLPYGMRTPARPT
jgi:hypothetical protein